MGINWHELGNYSQRFCGDGIGMNWDILGTQSHSYWDIVEYITYSQQYDIWVRTHIFFMFLIGEAHVLLGFYRHFVGFSQVFPHEFRWRSPASMRPSEPARRLSRRGGDGKSDADVVSDSSGKWWENHGKSRKRCRMGPPVDSVQLVYKWLNSMVYGRYNYS